MENIPNRLVRYKSRFLNQMAPESPRIAMEMDRVLEITSVTNSIMPELYTLLTLSKQELDAEIKSLSKRQFLHADLQEKQNSLRLIRREARRGDRINRRLARAVDALAGHDLVDAVAEKMTKPARRRFSRWQPNIPDLVLEYFLAAGDLTTAAYFGIRHNEVLANQALDLWGRLMLN